MCVPHELPLHVMVDCNPPRIGQGTPGHSLPRSAASTTHLLRYWGLGATAGAGERSSLHEVWLAPLGLLKCLFPDPLLFRGHLSSL